MDSLNEVYKKSQDIVEREIDGEIMLIPMSSDVVDLENGLLFSLNEVGRDIWIRIDGKRKVADISRELENIYEVDKDKCIQDVLGFLDELINRRLILEA